jgi:hypothetical protein
VTVNNPTDNYGWQMPDEGGDEDTWGTETNELIGDLVGAILSVDEILAGLQAELDVEQTRITGADERTSQLEGSAPRPAYARVWMGSGQVIAKATATKLNFDTESFQKETLWSSSTNPSRFTIPTDFKGLYTVRGVVRVPFATGFDNQSNEWYARIVKGGSTVIAETRIPYMNDDAKNDATVNDQTLIVEALVDAAEGEYFEIEVRYNWWGNGQATDALTGGAANTYFEIYRHRSPVVSVAATVGSATESHESTTTTHTMDMGEHVTGDLLVLIFNVRANVTMSVPAGWTLVKDSGLESTVTDGIVAYKVATSSSESGPVVTTNLGRTSASVVYVIPAATHNVPTQEVEMSLTDQGPADVQNMDPANLTPTWGPKTTLWIAVCAVGGDETVQVAVPTTPAGYVEDAAYDAPNIDQSVWAASRSANVASENPDGFEHDASNSGLIWLVAIPGKELD